MSFVAWFLGAVAIVQGGILLFGYLNHQVFPQPLSLEEEKRCLEAWNNGDEAAKEILIEHNLRLVAHVVKKYETSGESMEDLISIGTIGLIKAINTFSHEHGFKLATYASRCIDNEVLMHLRILRKVRNEVSMYEPIGYDKEGNEVSLIDVLMVDEGIFEEVEQKIQSDEIKRHLTVLNPREREVLELRYGIFTGIKETQRDIAKKLGISRSYVSRIENKAIKKMIGQIEKIENQ